jgi:hypothetical protein
MRANNATASSTRNTDLHRAPNPARPAEGTQVHMAWCPVPLWLVPDAAAAARLVAAGIPPGQIWSVDEVLALLAIPGMTEAEARHRALAKLEGDGRNGAPMRALIAERP